MGKRNINIKFIYIVFALSLTGLLPSCIIGQLPATSMYLFDYEISGDSVYFLHPRYISNFNKGGYNNQPYFFGSHEIYFSTNKYNPESTDIARLHLQEKTITRITATKESEFSPTLTPDNEFFTSVRIERNGKDQSLWKYPVDRSHYGERLLPDLENVGYHLWYSDHDVALFLVDNPVKLVLADIKTDHKKTLLDNIGRCMHLTENRELIIVHKLIENSWYLKRYNLATGRFKIITETIPDSEDFAVLPDGSILMAGGSTIWRFQDRGINSRWQKVDDFDDLNIKNINRIVNSDNTIIFVNQE